MKSRKKEINTEKKRERNENGNSSLEKGREGGGKEGREGKAQGLNEIVQ